MSKVRLFPLFIIITFLFLLNCELIYLPDNQQQDDPTNTQDNGENSPQQSNQNRAQQQLPEAPSEQQDEQYEKQESLQERTQNFFTKLKKGFQDFISLFKPDINEQEMPYRKGIYEQHVKQIQQHNSQPQKSYQKDVNSFADLTDEEFKGIYLMQQPGQIPSVVVPPIKIPPFFIMIPSDWRDKMGEAKHQMKCGSCWAFSVVEMIQQIVRIQRQEEREFSVQHLVDCVKKGANGCRGGWPVSAMQFIAENGLANSQDYPYVALRQKCNDDVETQKFLDADNPFMHITGVRGLQYGLTYGPVTVIVDARTWDPLYKVGIFNKCPDDNFNYNHAVLVVAVDLFGRWTIRNSWGSQWGDEGHIQLPPGNSCGIADMGLLPILA